MTTIQNWKSRFILWVAILWIGSQWTGADQTNVAPRIMCDEPEFRFGVRHDSVPLEHAFQIWNRGNAPLVIKNVRGSSGCGCRAGTMVADRVVNPGTNTIVRVNVSLRGERGPLRRSWFVESNDPEEPKCELAVSGIVVAEVEVRPPVINFGEIPPNCVAEQLAEITCQTNMVFQITNVVSPSPQFAVTFERLDTYRHRLKIRTVPPFKYGVTKGDLKVFTDNPKCGELTIFVVAAVPSRLVIVPQEIRMDMSGPRPAVYYLAIASRQKMPFKIVKMLAPDPSIRVSWNSLGPDRYRICLDNVIPSRDLDGKNLVIMTDHAEAEEVLVPIQVR